MLLRFGLIICVSIFIFPCHSSAFLEWFFGKTEEESKILQHGLGPKFEVVSTDDKFLDFAQSLSKLTPLDACYQIVVYSLQKKCGDLTEEELSKLSVQLLNCQSESEKRRVFPCTPSMTLAECTAPMDDIAWNSYQIVANRARAMCYAAQQQQFRQLTETTVSRLVTTATDQLSAMHQLKEGQEQLHSMTSETIRKLFDSQQELLGTHAALKSAQEEVFQHVTSNVQQLVTEKQLIATGNQQLAELIAGIKARLEGTQQRLEEQEKQEKEHHAAVLQDLSQIQDRAKATLTKIDEGLGKLAASQGQLGVRYAEMLDNLQRINSTVQHLLSAVSDMQHRVEERLGWLAAVLDLADDRLKLVTVCVSHIAYFVLVMATAAFLHIPLMARVLLMVVIVANVTSEINYHTSLDFAGMTILVFCTVPLYRLVTWMKRFSSPGEGSHPFLALADNSGKPLSPEELRALAGSLMQLQQSLTETLNRSASLHCNGSVPTSPSHTPAPPPPAPASPPRPESRNDNWSDEDSDDNVSERMSPPSHFASNLRERLSGLGPFTRSRSSTPQPPTSTTPLPPTSTTLLPPSRGSSRASTPSLSTRCQASTRMGTPCRNAAVLNSTFCRLHRLLH